MLLGLSSSVKPDVSLFSPPPRFLPVEQATGVCLAKSPYHKARTRTTGAQKAGLAYEKKAKAWLEAEFVDPLLGQWFYFFDGRSRRYCQPDVLLFERKNGVLSRITIVEIKIRWTESAWWQLKRLYAPVVRAFYQPQELRLVCMTRAFDPAVVVPEPVDLLDSSVPRQDGRNVGVFVWRP